MITRDDPLEGKTIDSRYLLRRRIGSGGLSVVYLAEQTGMDEPVAVKFLKSAFVNLADFVRRFEREAEAASRLDHPSCVRVMDFGVALGNPYLVMEFVDGPLLSSYLGGKAIPKERAVTITGQILHGLAHAHGRGIVHRDLKPGNIMLARVHGRSEAGASDEDEEETIAKIVDFGTAEIMTEDPSGQPKTGPARAGTQIGTPHYMAPEQITGEPTDGRTDLYAVGVILFEMVTGDRPFTAEDPMRVLEMHLRSPVPSARALRPETNLSPELEAVIVRAMQKSKEARFATAEEMAEALSRTKEARPPRPSSAYSAVELTPPPAIVAPPSLGATRGFRDEGFWRRHRVALALVGMFVAAGVAVAALHAAGVL
jgi:eukaryotic-like serine/threonine-protein kinase